MRKFMWMAEINETQMGCFQTLKVKLCVCVFPLYLKYFEKLKAIFESALTLFFLFIFLVGNLLVLSTFYKCQYVKTSQWWANS